MAKAMHVIAMPTVRLMERKNPRATPSSAEWASESPK
jgi:hypothetical protein